MPHAIALVAIAASLIAAAIGNAITGGGEHWYHGEGGGPMHDRSACRLRS